MSAAADRMARCRQEFAEAFALGISIPALRERRAAERAALRDRAGDAVRHHTGELMNGASEASYAAENARFEDFDARWMMRN